MKRLEYIPWTDDLFEPDMQQFALLLQCFNAHFSLVINFCKFIINCIGQCWTTGQYGGFILSYAFLRSGGKINILTCFCFQADEALLCLNLVFMFITTLSTYVIKNGNSNDRVILSEFFDY